MFTTKNMEEKKQIVDEVLCAACLGLGRALHNVTDEKLRQYYLEALNEMPLCSNQRECLRLCWECCARLKKAVEFKEQVKDCYRILQTYTNDTFYECLFTEITRPSRLKVHVVEPVSITGDKHPQDEKEPRDRLYVKEEIEILWDKGSSELKDSKTQSHIDSSDDDLPLSECLSNGDVDTLTNDVKQEDIKINKQTRKAKRVKKFKKKIDIKKCKEDKSSQKIITIELSYEEMMAEREADMAKDTYLKAEFKCESCVVGFNYNKSYKTHLKAKHCETLGEYTCPVCKTVLSTLDSLTAHYKRHTKRYECSICRKRTMDVKVMQQHYFSSHEIALKQYTCNICGKQSNSIDTHRYHKDTHKARVQCSDCDKTFSHRAGLMNHTLAVHEYNNAFPCPECDKVFRWKTSLTRHLEKHDVKNKSSSPAYCTTCEVSFSSISSYQRHMKNSLKHVTQDQLKFTCDHCDRRFADKTKLRDHIEEKHLHRTYECHICSKPSKNRVGLDQHIRNVHKGRPNNKMCHHCGKGFPTKVQLESHIRTHTGERPFICEYCPTTFSQQSNLYKHNRQVHLNIKSKRYPLCKKQKDINNIEQTIATVNQTIDNFRSMPVYEREFVM